MAEGFSILDPQGRPKAEDQIPAFYFDLNLDQIIARVSRCWGENIRPYYAYFPKDREGENYRRQVFQDVKQPETAGVLFRFHEHGAKIREARKQGEEVSSPLQKAYWLLCEIESYCCCYEELGGALKEAPLSSQGLVEFREILQRYINEPDYLSMRDQVRRILGEIRALRFVLTYEKDRIVLSLGEGQGDYEGFLEKWGETKGFETPFHANSSLSVLEQDCLEILVKKKPELFRKLSDLAVQYGDYAKPELERFRREITFYLSFLKFERTLQEKGFSFTAPTCDQDRKMESRGLYDLALACRCLQEDITVVSNDMEYDREESFFVLTGPNQGGKTTFARSLGQLVFFAKLGLDVPARSANVHYFQNILTHFSVEESVETGRGKLKEELVRLAPMMKGESGNCFVIINELFTTAASYDAEIMGRKVLTHFIRQGCRGIYVTHLKELAGVHPRVVSLRAMLNEQKIQTFQIRRSQAEESACAANQVNKHRLTYAQLKERL